MTVDYETYVADKKSFFNKHKGDFQVYTSPMDEYDRYTKIYSFPDNSQWYELMSPETEYVEVEVHLVKTEVAIKLLKVEYWSTDSPSKYYYEKY